MRLWWSETKFGDSIQFSGKKFGDSIQFSGKKFGDSIPLRIFASKIEMLYARL
jgi:hypothetical protein